MNLRELEDMMDRDENDGQDEPDQPSKYHLIKKVVDWAILACVGLPTLLLCLYSFFSMILQNTVEQAIFAGLVFGGLVALCFACTWAMDTVKGKKR